MRGLDFGYSQTKWVSEQIVLKAIDQGIDARIYRPAFLSASRYGYSVAGDVIVRTLAYMIRHQLSVTAENQLSILPVDVCAQNIVAIASIDDPGARIFHLTADKYYTMRAACECLTERYGYKFDYVDVGTFIEHMNKWCTPSETLFPLLAFFRTNSGKLNGLREKRYDNANLRLVRKISDHLLPEPCLKDIMEYIVQSLRKERLIAPTAEMQANERSEWL